jgi:hypothetical protein
MIIIIIIIIRRIGCPSIVDKEIRIQRSHDCVENTRARVEIKKASQVSIGACVGKPERALSETKNSLDGDAVV